MTRTDCPSPDFCPQRSRNSDKDVLKFKREVVRERKREGEVENQKNKQPVEIEDESNGTSLLSLWCIRTWVGRMSISKQNRG